MPEIDDNQAFPAQVLEVGRSNRLLPSAPSSSIGLTVEGALREILAWRPKPEDPKGFTAALNQAFSLRDIEGHTEFAWTPRSFSVQADIGAVTGAQASIYSRARSALDQSLPLLEGLYPLQACADAEDGDSIRAIIRNHWIELVAELGQVGGPRLDRVQTYFDALIGLGLGGNPESVGGLLGTMRERFGFARKQVNTIDEEQNLTNYLILVDHTISLHRSWNTLKHFFDRVGDDVFLGTQLVLISRSLAVLAESVQESYFSMDSVYVGSAERQTITLKLDDKTRLTVAELLGWVERFALEEGPRLIREGGKDGVEAFKPTLEKLEYLVGRGADIASAQADNPTAGFHTKRVQFALREVHLGVKNALALVRQLRRSDDPKIILIDPENVTADAEETVKQTLALRGAGFDEDARFWLNRSGHDQEQLFPLANTLIRVSQAELNAKFEFEIEHVGLWTAVVRNSDGNISRKEDAFEVLEPTDSGGVPVTPAPQIDNVKSSRGDDLRDALQAFLHGKDETEELSLGIEGMNLGTPREVRLEIDTSEGNFKVTSDQEQGEDTKVKATFILKYLKPQSKGNEQVNRISLEYERDDKETDDWSENFDTGGSASSARGQPKTRARKTTT
jgi:hypothetical protein